MSNHSFICSDIELSYETERTNMSIDQQSILNQTLSDHELDTAFEKVGLKGDEISVDSSFESVCSMQYPVVSKHASFNESFEQLPLLVPTMSIQNQDRDEIQVLRAIIVVANEGDEFGNDVVSSMFGTKLNEEGQIVEDQDDMRLIAIVVTPENRGSKIIPKPVDAIIFVESDDEQIPESYNDLATKYKHLMYKIVIGRKDASPSQGWGLKLNVNYMPLIATEGRPMIKDIFTTVKSGREAIEQVFKSFDKDESGTIEIDELRQVAAELGHEITEDELQIVFDEIDENKNGKISLDEFAKWWQKGRKGMSNTMKKITGLKMKVNNLGESVQRLLGEETEEGMADLQVNITRTDEKIEAAGIEVDIHVESGVSDLCQQMADRAGLANLDTFAVFIFKTDKNIDDAKDKISAILMKAVGFITAINRRADKILTKSVEFRIRSGEDKVYLFVIVNPNDPMTQRVSDDIKNFFKSYLEACSEKQVVKAHLACEAGLDEIADSSDLLFFEPLIEAFQLSFSAKIWKRYRNILWNFMEKKIMKQDLSPLFLFSEAKVNLSLDSLNIYPEKLIKTLRRQSNERYQIPKGTDIKNLPVEHIVEKLPLIESTARILSEYFDASEFKVCGVVHGLSFHTEFKLPNLSSISPFKTTSK